MPNLALEWHPSALCYLVLHGTEREAVVIGYYRKVHCAGCHHSLFFAEPNCLMRRVKKFKVTPGADFVKCASSYRALTDFCRENTQAHRSSILLRQLRTKALEEQVSLSHPLFMCKHRREYLKLGSMQGQVGRKIQGYLAASPNFLLKKCLPCRMDGPVLGSIEHQLEIGN